MRTYILDILNRYKRFNENLDVKTVLCNRSWWIFNDSGEKELYIFQNDGSLIISISGRVIKANWEYISANKSLIITSNEQSYMLHPAFIDDAIFVLRVDGTQESCFMIEENNRSSFYPKSLSDLNDYFEEKQKQLERKEREEKVRIQRQKIASERWQAQQAEIERIRVLEETRKENAETAWKCQKDSITNSDAQYLDCLSKIKRTGRKNVTIYIICLISIFLITKLISPFVVETFDGWGIIGLIVVPALLLSSPFIYYSLYGSTSKEEWAIQAREQQLHNKFIEDYYKTHPIE